MRELEPQVSDSQGIPAAGILVVAFLDEMAADQALNTMKEAKRQKQFYFEDAAVVRQDAQGEVHFHETGDMSASKGAGIGLLVGGILGMLGGPAGIVLAVNAGAITGAVIGDRDKGFKDGSLETVGMALKPGTSAIAAITSHDFLKTVQTQLTNEEIRAAVGNLAAELSARLSENKNVAIGVLLTEDGIGIKEIAANEDSAEIVSAVITGGATAATAEDAA